jgi:alcohol dehydrogenase class IV
MESSMQLFTMRAVPEILFGQGRLDELGSKVSAIAGTSLSVFLLADPALAPSGTIAKARQSLSDAGHTAAVFDGFAGEPTSELIDAASAMAYETKAQCIVGLGGGTVLDTAKLVACCAASGDSAEVYELCKTPLPAGSLPCIAIPTTAGTGSEVTSTSVFTNSRHVKVWAWGSELKPRLALLDPELTIGVPQSITAATALDALVHAIEACTNRNRNDMADLFCHRAISLITANLGRVLANGADIEARGALLLGSCLAGIGIENCGTALAHNISHALASLAPIPHGRATGLAMLATIDWVAEAAPDDFSRVARAMGQNSNPSSAVEVFAKLVRSSGIKVSLAGEGFYLNRPDMLAAQMAAPENASMRKSTPRLVSDDDLLMLATRLYALR